MSLDLDFAAAVAHDLAAAAGRMMRDGLVNRTLTFKDDGSEVTDIDVAINTAVLDVLGAAFPDHQVLGEESSGTITDLDQPTWVVDPIDGTLPYAAGVGLGCFSLALVVGGVPVVAAVEDPWVGFGWRAVTGRGAWRNGLRCVAAARPSLHGARIDVEANSEYAALSGALVDAGACAFCQWATVRTACAVADGGYDATVYGPGKPWDIAAVSLIVAEAGGVVGNLDGTVLHAAQPVGRWIAAGSQTMWDAVADTWAPLVGNE
jgi:fructose-1,6-bisphosphatase/inositol monophosphatase family enzyme